MPTWKMHELVDFCCGSREKRVVHCIPVTKCATLAQKQAVKHSENIFSISMPFSFPLKPFTVKYA